MLLTVSSVWIIYEVIVLVWTEFLSRKLATWEKIVLVVLGLVVAIYGGRSEHQDSVAMAKLGQTVTDTQAQLKIAKDQLAKISQQQDFSKGQLDIIGKIDARTLRTLASKTDISPNAGPDSVANAASAKVDALSRQLGDLQKQTVLQLSDNQRAELNRVLSGEKLQFLETEYIPTNDLSVMFEKELLEIFRAHNWQVSTIPNITIVSEGIFIGIGGDPHKLNHTQHSDRIAKILSSAGIQASFGYDVELSPTTDYHLLVGRKPS